MGSPWQTRCGRVLHLGRLGALGWAYPEKLGACGLLKLIALVELLASIWLFGHAVFVGFYAVALTVQDGAAPTQRVATDVG